MRQLNGITDSMDMGLSVPQFGDGQGGLACCSPTVQQRLDGITDSTDMNLSRLQEMVKDREACHAAVYGVAK